MEKNYEYRFELKPGKFVFVPTPECVVRGKKISYKVLKNWTPREYFYHFHKRGGHVAAMRPHVPHQFKASIDLSGFFTAVSRTKVHRALKSVGFANRNALDLASESCVEMNGRKFLPYGFVQSMVLATLAVENSLLGKTISDLRENGATVTMYVDDIILSGNDLYELEADYEKLVLAANSAGFPISEEKSSSPAENVSAFNCELTAGEITVIDERMQRFVEDGLNGSERTKEAILRYVGVLNKQQRDELNQIFA